MSSPETNIDAQTSNSTMSEHTEHERVVEHNASASDELTDVSPESDHAGHEPDQTELRRSAREKKLALKAKENKIVVLSQFLIGTIDEQSSKIEDFLENANDISDEDVESFLAIVDSSKQSVFATSDEIEQLSENKLDRKTQTIVDQFLADVQLEHDHWNQRNEEDEELKEAERKAEEAKRELEIQMQQIELRMAARRERMQRKLNRTTGGTTENIGRPPAPLQTSEGSILTASAELSRPTQQITQTQALELSNLRQPQEPRPALKTSAASVSNISGSGSLNTASRELSTDWRPAREPQPDWRPAREPQTDWRPAREPQTDWREPQAANIAHDITEHMHISLLAPPEPSIFKGDPLEYADWRISFNSLIDSKRGTPIEKLHRLMKYVDGDAKEAISGYFKLQTTDAYQEALQTLHDEFGREDMIENSFRDRLEEWPKIANRDQDALKKYSYFLRQCLAAQRTIPKLQVLDDKRENKKFIKALPGWLANRWIYYVAEQEEKGGFPPFSRYATFVAHEARVSNHNLREAEDNKPSTKAATKKEKAYSQSPN